MRKKKNPKWNADINQLQIQKKTTKIAKTTSKSVSVCVFPYVILYQVIELSFHVSVQESLITFTTPPKDEIFSSKIMCHL